jgi:hypothetical protein
MFPDPWPARERVSALKSKLEKLEEAFIYQHSIDRATYDRQHDRVEEELALAEVDLQEARIDSISGVLGGAVRPSKCCWSSP